MGDTTSGLVCGHHHLYSALARGMPAPPRTPTTFLEILEQVWWRLDVSLDLEMLRWSAMLGALEALECGTTAIVDHHEGPSAIEGSLDVISQACAQVGVRVRCCYGVTDRHGPDGARRGLEENERFLRAARAGGTGGPGAAATGGLAASGMVGPAAAGMVGPAAAGMVGIHAAFTCSDATLEAAAGLARDLGVGVHVHVAEGAVDAEAPARLSPLVADDWIVAHGVHIPRPVPAPFAGTTLAHCARSNMHNAVGYAHPRSWGGPVVLGSDGIGADMLEEFRFAYVKAREQDVLATPTEAWAWLEGGWGLVPEARGDRVRWSYEEVDDPWCLAFTPGVRAVDVWVGGEQVLKEGTPTRVDPHEVRSRASEQALRLFERL